MPSFKPKSIKTIEIKEKNITTLDNKHEELTQKFTINNNEIIPKLEAEKQEKKNELIKFKKQNINGSNNELVFNLKDDIKKISKKIQEKKKEEKEYYLNNSKYIFDYFENKKSIANGASKMKLLNKFFNIDNSNSNLSKDNETVKKYLSNVDDKFLDINNFIFQNDICKYCKEGEMIPLDNEGQMICNNCSKCVKCLVDNDKPSYKEPPKEVCFYAYKRINHFREILAQFQAKETTLIPEDVLNNIKLQIKKERISIQQVSNKKAKEILKKLGYNKYYEHIPFIKDKLGIRPPIMSSELEETLCNLFMDIQGPYAKYCPHDRVNFLNYYYTVYKLCELLGQTQFLPFFPMLKDREKRIEQDEIWKNICNDLEWEFIPTI